MKKAQAAGSRVRVYNRRSGGGVGGGRNGRGGNTERRTSANYLPMTDVRMKRGPEEAAETPEVL